MKNLVPCCRNRGNALRNVITVALVLVLTYGDAFVISSAQKFGNFGAPARLRQREQVLQQLNQLHRGGGGGGGTAGSSSTQSSLTETNSLRHPTQVNVLQVYPDTIRTESDNYNNNNNDESNGKSLLNGRIPASFLRNNGGFQEQVQQPKFPKNNAQKVEKYAVYVAETKLPTDIGHFQLRGYRVPGAPLGQEPCVIYARDKPPMGRPGKPAQNVPVRIHDQCLTSEVFRSQRCDCKEQLQMALHYIQKYGGFIVYLQQEGRGIGLANKIAAYALQDVGFDTVDANLHLGFKDDQREYDIIPSILKDLNVDSIHLMTNNPRKVHRLTALGVNVERTLPMVVPAANPYNRKYLETKRTRMNHENLAKLLTQDAVRVNGVFSSSSSSSSASHMAPRRLPEYISLAEQYINNGTEMSANAVQVSLMLEDESVAEQIQEEEGAKARSDGYCFGRASVEAAIRAIARGEMVVVVDDMDRENEGDFIMAAEQCTALDMAQIIRYSSGVVCLAMEGDRLEALKLPPMVVHNEDPKGTAFAVSVDATKEHGISTGISASDRSKTVRMLADPNFGPGDFHRPGHIFPLRARPGGVLSREGHTEAAVDLARLAGLRPAGLLCEIVSEDNPTEMMRLPEIKRFCKAHSYVLTSIADIIQYRRDTETV